MQQMSRNTTSINFLPGMNIFSIVKQSSGYLVFAAMFIDYKTYLHSYFEFLKSANRA